jgi:multiple antibiotic resistance protein
MIDPAFLVTAFAALFVVIDPIGLTPIFVALTRGMSATRRRALAVRACVISFAILLVFALFGEAVLGFIGISMPAFRVAGGILLFLTALDMLFERRQKRRRDQADEDDEDEEDDEDPSVFPLAIPLIAGPGAIATIILLVGQSTGPVGFVATMGVLLAVLALVLVLFLGAGLLERLLGKVGINVVTRLLGMLLAALSVQFVLDGLRSFGLGG